jgi:hypothetical protein
MQELDDAMEELSESTDAASAAENQAKKVVLQKMKADLAAEAATKALSEATRKATNEMVGRTIQGTGQFVKSLQADASGTALATELMVMGIDVAGTAAKGVGRTLNAFGDAAIAAGVATEGLGFIVGGAMKILGTALDAGAETMSKLAKFGVEVLSKEVEKSYKAFNQMNSSGALFSNGLQGMRDASLSAGLTVEQMSNVIKVNSSSIAASGLGVTEGTKRIGGAFRAGGDALKNQLFNLGFGVEEQVGLISDVTRQLRITGKTINDKDVAEQTKKYAENLRTIANITGEDAKKKMEEAEASSRELIFRQKVAQAGYDMTDVIASMAGMNEVQKKNFMDRVASEGAVINEHGAMMNAQVKGFREQGQDLYKSFKDGSLSLDVVKNSNAKYAEVQNKSIMANQALGRAGYFAGEEVGELTKSMSNLVDFNNKNTKAAADNSKAVGEAATTQDGLTTSLIGAEKAAQGMKVKLQEMMDVPIKHFAEVSEAMLTEVSNMLASMGMGKGGVGSNQVNNNVAAAENKTKAADKALEDQYKKAGYSNKYTGAMFANSKDVQKARQDAKVADEQEEKIKRARVEYLTGMNAVKKRLQNDADEKKYGIMGSLGIKGGAEVDKTKLATALTEYNKDFATLENSLDPAQSKQRLEYAKMLGMTKESNYAPKVTMHDKGGRIGAGRLGIAGENGPELIGGPSSVLSTASTEKLIIAIDAMREMKGTRMGANDFDWQVGMSEGRMATLKDRVKGFEGFDANQLQEEFMKRPEASPIKNAMKQMDDDERNDSAAEAAAHLAEIANLMRQNVDHTARVAANTN